MRIITKKLGFVTKKEFEIINVTKQVEKIFEDSKIKEGFLNIFSRHTTLAVKINEDEELLLKDFNEFMNKLAPERDYHHDNLKLRKNCMPNEPKNAKGHLRTLILESSQIIPISSGKLLLGRFQNIFLIETSGGREREIVVQVVGIDYC